MDRLTQRALQTYLRTRDPTDAVRFAEAVVRSSGAPDPAPCTEQEALDTIRAEYEGNVNMLAHDALDRNEEEILEGDREAVIEDVEGGLDGDDWAMLPRAYLTLRVSDNHDHAAENGLLVAQGPTARSWEGLEVMHIDDEHMRRLVQASAYYALRADVFERLSELIEEVHGLEFLL